MIEIRIINLLLALAGFACLMYAFAYEIKCLKFKFTPPRIAKFWFLVTCLGFCCFEIWNLRYERGTTLAVWNCWAILVSWLLTKFSPFKTETEEDFKNLRKAEQVRH